MMTYAQARATGQAVRRAGWALPFAVRWTGEQWAVAGGWCVGAVWRGVSAADQTATDWSAA